MKHRKASARPLSSVQRFVRGSGFRGSEFRLGFHKARGRHSIVEGTLACLFFALNNGVLTAALQVAPFVLYGFAGFGV